MRLTFLAWQLHIVIALVLIVVLKGHDILVKCSHSKYLTDAKDKDLQSGVNTLKLVSYFNKTETMEAKVKSSFPL